VFALARWAEPWGLQQLNAVLNDVIKRNLQSGLEPGIFNDGLPRFMIYVADEERAPDSAYATWRGVLIEDDVGDGAPLLALAEVGRIEDAGGETLALRLFRGEIHRMEAAGETVARFQEGSFLVGVQDPVAHKNRFSNSEVALNSAELRRRIPELLRRNEPRLAARFRLELVRRWVVPFACLAFAVLGVPLAVAARGARGSAYLITLGVFIAFYALSRFSMALAENGLHPWVAGMLPVGVVLAIGSAYTVQLARSGVGKPG
jgi:lipopolysaccharide export system permease protein